jgi:hypothetical protein
MVEPEAQDSAIRYGDFVRSGAADLRDNDVLKSALARRQQHFA